MTTEYIYHLTGEELRAAMLLAIEKYQIHHSSTAANAVEEAMLDYEHDTDLENSLPLVDEDDWWLNDSQATEHLRLVEIPFDGSTPATVDDGDNISPAAIGLEPVA